MYLALNRFDKIGIKRLSVETGFPAQSLYYYLDGLKDKKLVGDVYSVLPDQVSLTPPTGQYLAKGSVMIYGEKLYYKNIEINHAIGVVIFDEYAQVIAGPSASVENRTGHVVNLKPGHTPKGSIAKAIREKFISQCPDEERYKIEALTVNDFLPFIPGDSDFLT